MALLLPKSVFIHIPKTGGHWVRKAIENAGIHAVEARCSWHAGQQPPIMVTGNQGNRWRHVCYHASFQDIEPDHRLSFTFVRHPLSYYRSYWSYKMAVGWDHTSTFDSIVADDSFQQFAEKVLQFHQTRGWVSTIYRCAIDRSDSTQVSFIGKTEQLEDDLVRALTQAGETFDETALRQTARINVHGQDPARAKDVELRNDTYRMLLEAEKDALKRFCYPTS